MIDPVPDMPSASHFMLAPHPTQEQADGALVVTYNRTERWLVEDGKPRVHQIFEQRVSYFTQMLPRGGNRSRIAWLAAAGAACVALLLAAGLWIGRAKAPLEPATALSISLPETGAAKRNRAAQPSAPAPARLATATIALPAAAPAAAPPAGDREVTVDQAMGKAFATNDAQAWTAGGAYGWVVVGPAQAKGDMSCRNVAVLTRSIDGADQTLNDRKCRKADGTIVTE